MKKYITNYLLFLFILIISSNLYSSEYFGGLDGIRAAKSKALELGFNDSKLIYIGAFPYNLSSLNGRLDGWYYVLAHNKNQLCAYISVIKENGNFIAKFEKDAISDKLYPLDKFNSIGYGSNYIEFSDFSEITENLMDSDTTYKSIKQKHIIGDNLWWLLEFNTFIISVKNYKEVNISNNIDKFIWVSHLWKTFFDPNLPGDNWSFYHIIVSANRDTLLKEVILVDINDDKQLDENSIYPNPASDYIEISINSSLNFSRTDDIELINQFGEKIIVHYSKESISGNKRNFKMDVSNLSSGVYFIKIGNIFKKFVKM
jgi:hypothetical protein